MPLKPWWMWLTESLLAFFILLMMLSFIMGAYNFATSLDFSLNVEPGSVATSLITSLFSIVVVVVIPGIGYFLYRQGKAWLAPYFDEYLDTQVYQLQHSELMELAMRRVNVDAANSEITLRNIGWLCYRSSDDPSPLFIRAGGQLPLEAQYLRPFIELQEMNFLEKKITHQIDLEVCQHNSQVIFSETQTHDIKKSKNLIIAKSWLPLAQRPKKSPWSIRVRVDGKMLAIHLYQWSKISQQHIKGERLVDGEISRQMQRLVNESDGLTGISLDDLLGEQVHS